MRRKLSAQRVAQLKYIAAMVASLYVLFSLTVALKKFDCQIARRETSLESSFALKRVNQFTHSALYIVPKTHVDMSHHRLAIVIYFYNGIE